MVSSHCQPLRLNSKQKAPNSSTSRKNQRLFVGHLTVGGVFSGTILPECGIVRGYHCRPQRKAQSVEEDSEFVRVTCGEEIPKLLRLWQEIYSYPS